MATTSLPTSSQLDWSGNALLTTDAVVSGSLFVGGSEFAAADLDYVNNLTATAAEVNRATDVSGRIVNVTAATLAVAEATHEGKTVTLNKVDGQTMTMPAATGGGARYRFVIGTTSTSNAYVFSPTGNNTIKGVAVLGDSTDGTAHIWATAAGNNTLTLGGTDNATGGIEGTVIIYEDIAADVWLVTVIGDAGGTEASPFSTV